MLDWLREKTLAEQMISPDDVELLHVTDDPEEAVEVVVERYEGRRSTAAAAGSRSAPI